MICPLCGLRFRQSDGIKVCGNCLLCRTCNKVGCPNCGYEVVPDIQENRKSEKKVLEESYT